MMCRAMSCHAVMSYVWWEPYFLVRFSDSSFSSCHPTCAERCSSLKPHVGLSKGYEGCIVQSTRVWNKGCRSCHTRVPTIDNNGYPQRFGGSLWQSFLPGKGGFISFTSCRFSTGGQGKGTKKTKRKKSDSVQANMGKFDGGMLKLNADEVAKIRKRR